MNTKQLKIIENYMLVNHYTRREREVLLEFLKIHKSDEFKITIFDKRKIVESINIPLQNIDNVLSNLTRKNLLILMERSVYKVVDPMIVKVIDGKPTKITYDFTRRPKIIVA